MKTFLLATLSLLLVSCSTSSFMGGEPNFSKAFPDRQLLIQEQDDKNPKSQTYWYTTDSTFDVGKRDFKKFLGKNWIGIESTEKENRELTKIVGKNDKTLLVEGSAIYISPKFPGRKVGFMQINKFPTQKLLFIYDEKP